jgi:hypothetical protein
VADNIEDPFAVETELLGLKLLPGQEANLRAAYAFAPAPGAERRR